MAEVGQKKIGTTIWIYNTFEAQNDDVVSGHQIHKNTLIDLGRRVKHIHEAWNVRIRTWTNMTKNVLYSEIPRIPTRFFHVVTGSKPPGQRKLAMKTLWVHEFRYIYFHSKPKLFIKLGGSYKNRVAYSQLIQLDLNRCLLLPTECS